MKELRYWYRIEMLSGDHTYCFFGSCLQDESALMTALAQGEWVLAEDLVYFDEQDRAQGWSEWDPNYFARIHLNPSYVISVMPMLDDPRKKMEGINEMLTLPRIQEKKNVKASATKKQTAKKSAARKSSAKKNSVGKRTPRKK
jgi:hypothetical protein